MKKIFNKIKKLDKMDLKPIFVKIAKTTEELGELSEVLLIEDGYKVSNKFSDKEDIRNHKLEEGVDVLIQALSLLNTMGFTYDEVEKEFNKKCSKWENNIKKKKLGYKNF
jgi:NTP pyrophosphatase (non-canonical NTP hydrolase)